MCLLQTLPPMSGWPEYRTDQQILRSVQTGRSPGERALPDAGKESVGLHQMRPLQQTLPVQSLSAAADGGDQNLLWHLKEFDRNGHFFNFYRHLMQRQEKYGTIYHITCRLRMERRQSQKRIAKIRFTWGSDCTGEDLRKKEEGFS